MPLPHEQDEFELPPVNAVEMTFMAELLGRVQSPWLRYLMTLEFDAVAERFAEMERCGSPHHSKDRHHDG